MSMRESPRSSFWLFVEILVYECGVRKMFESDEDRELYGRVRKCSIK